MMRESKERVSNKIRKIDRKKVTFKKEAIGHQLSAIRRKVKIY